MAEIEEALFSENCNFCYKSIRNQSLSDMNARRSLFKNMLFDGCRLCRIDFSSSDFDGSVVRNTDFVECLVNNADIRSLEISGCTFSRTDFSHALVVDCRFVNCRFEDCLLDYAKIERNEFVGCSIENSPSNHCAAMLNTYSGTAFEGMAFKNVSYYQIFRECTFRDVGFEAYLLGYSYGLTMQDLGSLNLVFMGDRRPGRTAMECIDGMADIYLERSMLLNLGILQFLSDGISKEACLLQCIRMLAEMTRRGIIAQSESVDFLLAVYSDLRDGGRITPIAKYQMMAQMERIEGQSSRKARETLRVFRNAVLLDFNGEFDAMLSRREKRSDDPARITIRFNRKPDIELATLLDECSGEAGAAVSIGQRTGSFIEVLSAGDWVVTYLTFVLNSIGLVVECAREHKKRREYTCGPGARKKPQLPASIHIDSVNIYYSTSSEDSSDLEKARHDESARDAALAPTDAKAYLDALAAALKMGVTPEHGYQGLGECTGFTVETEFK